MQLIERECSIKLSIRGVGNYLKRWGFTPQKPIKKAYEQCPASVKQWLDDNIPSSNNVPRPKVPRFTGVTKQHW
jgi:transposase